MIFKSRYTKTNYPANANRLKRCFAWLPVYIEGDMIWLSMYEVMQVYSMQVYATQLDNKTVGFEVYKWIDVSKRLIPKNIEL